MEWPAQQEGAGGLLLQPAWAHRQWEQLWHGRQSKSWPEILHPQGTEKRGRVLPTSCSYLQNGEITPYLTKKCRGYSQSAQAVKRYSVLSSPSEPAPSVHCPQTLTKTTDKTFTTLEQQSLWSSCHLPFVHKTTCCMQSSLNSEIFRSGTHNFARASKHTL